MQENLPQSIGYLASALLIISFLMKDLRNIRVINLLGCLCFVIYGCILEPKPAYPIIITNLVICGIQVYYLFLSKKPNA